MEKSIFCPRVLESLYESVLLTVDSELLNALWLWPGTIQGKHYLHLLGQELVLYRLLGGVAFG